VALVASSAAMIVRAARSTARPERRWWIVWAGAFAASIVLIAILTALAWPRPAVQASLEPTAAAFVPAPVAGPASAPVPAPVPRPGAGPPPRARPRAGPGPSPGPGPRARARRRPGPRRAKARAHEAARGKSARPRKTRGRAGPRTRPEAELLQTRVTPHRHQV